MLPPVRELPAPAEVDEDGDARCDARRCDRKADHALVLDAGTTAYRCQWHAELLTGERRGAVLDVVALHADAAPVSLAPPSAGAKTASVLLVVAVVAVLVGFLALVPVLL